MKKDSEITEDDLKQGEKQVQDLTDKFCKEIDQLSSDKQKEIMSLYREVPSASFWAPRGADGP